MATLKQKRVARLIVENTNLDKPLNAGQIVEKGRYGKGAMIHPNSVLESKGVKEELKILGFDEDSAKKVVAEILNNGKEENRIRAAQEIFKVQGSYAPEKHLIKGKVDFGKLEEANNEELKRIADSGS